MLFDNSRRCVATLGPISTALKAQRALLDAGITAEVQSLAPGETRNGCAYGVAFGCPERDNVRRVLRAARINVLQYITRDLP